MIICKWSRKKVRRLLRLVSMRRTSGEKRNVFIAWVTERQNVQSLGHIHNNILPFSLKITTGVMK